MILTILYHLAILALYVVTLIASLTENLPSWLSTYEQAFFCILAGGLGGSVYCLRGIYLNASVNKKWDPVYRPWYYLRPIVSLCCGFVSFIFLKAGLLVLDANLQQDSNFWGFYALAFIAGLNVDGFVRRIEGIAHAAWGIEKSRTATKNDDKKE